MSLLVLIAFLPLLGALAIALLPSANSDRLRTIALGVTSVVAGLGVALFLRFDGAYAPAQYVVDAAWFTLPGSTIDVRFHFGVDGLSILLVALTAVLMPIVVLSSYGHIDKRVK